MSTQIPLSQAQPGPELCFLAGAGAGPGCTRPGTGPSKAVCSSAIPRVPPRSAAVCNPPLAPGSAPSWQAHPRLLRGAAARDSMDSRIQDGKPAPGPTWLQIWEPWSCTGWRRNMEMGPAAQSCAQPGLPGQRDAPGGLGVANGERELLLATSHSQGEDSQ